jgi:alpha-glucoside transport system substrate-binding protein
MPRSKRTSLVLIAFMMLYSGACSRSDQTEFPDGTAGPIPTVNPVEAMVGASDLEIDCLDTNSGDSLTIVYPWKGPDQEKFTRLLDQIERACGIEFEVEVIDNMTDLDIRMQVDPPDILIWHNLIPLNLYQNQLLDLEELGANPDPYPAYWQELLWQNESWVALPVRAEIESLVWYNPVEFEGHQYSVPTTFEELEALMAEMTSDGVIPWSMGFEAQADTGGAGAAFIQDLLLVQQDWHMAYDLISGEIPYSDPAVAEAYQKYLTWANDPAITPGGAQGVLNTNVNDAILTVFSQAPGAMMVRQAGFAGDVIFADNPDLIFGLHYDFFVFPGVNGLQGKADFIMAFNDTAATRTLLTFFTSPQGAVAWAQSGFDLSPNLHSLGQYLNQRNQKMAEILANAQGLALNLDAAIPAPFGQAERQAVRQLLEQGELLNQLQDVAQAQADALGLEIESSQ